MGAVGRCDIGRVRIQNEEMCIRDRVFAELL